MIKGCRTMKNLKVTIEYDGTNYAGWQIQKNAITIQQKIEEALKDLTKEDIKVIGASRTDARVHARAFAANFITESTIPSERFCDALNNILPSDIVILKSQEVPINFHARFNSKGKTYSYTILNRRVRPTIEKNYVYHYKKKLDYEAIVYAAKSFVGTHDFTAFKSNGGSAKTSIRTISNFQVLKKDDKLTFLVTGDGFLYNMVRIMIGTLVKVGSGKIDRDAISQIILSENREKAGPCAPPQGLCLEKVYY